MKFTQYLIWYSWIFDCYVIVTWVLAQEWALFLRAAKTVTWALTWEWALARDTTVNPSQRAL